MKEMCGNFICNTNKCPAAQQRCPRNTQCSMASPAAENTAILSNTEVLPMGDCNACVLERIGLAQAFVPSQPYEQPMEQEQSLICGTAFSELVMPYCSGWNLYRFAKEA